MKTWETLAVGDVLFKEAATYHVYPVVAICGDVIFLHDWIIGKDVYSKRVVGFTKDGLIEDGWKIKQPDCSMSTGEPKECSSTLKPKAEECEHSPKENLFYWGVVSCCKCGAQLYPNKEPQPDTIEIEGVRYTEQEFMEARKIMSLTEHVGTSIKLFKSALQKVSDKGGV